jgi:hypothetical protein
MNRKSLIRQNAEARPDYCPYCLRCRAWVRMKKVEAFFWRCARCGAEHDERIPDEAAEPRTLPVPEALQDNQC